ncbi:MAG: hypothetical protein INR66_04005 [Gordonia polyisoprenivorans]|nr:hypothetical protein [Gordonia polyisoprenivorans]
MGQSTDDAARDEELQRLRRENDAMRSSTVDAWLTIALAGDVVASARRPDQGAIEEQLRLMQDTLSWRITAPLRAVRRRL